MLGDLNRLVKPRLYILDGITAMEGNGPHLRGSGAHASAAFVGGSGGSGQRLLPSDTSGSPAGAHQCPGRTDGPGDPAAGKHRAVDGGGPHGTFPGGGAGMEIRISASSEAGKKPGAGWALWEFLRSSAESPGSGGISAGNAASVWRAVRWKGKPCILPMAGTSRRCTITKSASAVSAARKCALTEQFL